MCALSLTSVLYTKLLVTHFGCRSLAGPGAKVWTFLGKGSFLIDTNPGHFLLFSRQWNTRCCSPSGLMHDPSTEHFI